MKRIILLISLFLMNQAQGQQALVKAQKINKPVGTTFVHAPSLVEMTPGTFLAAFYAGKEFQSPDTKIYLSSYVNEQWSEPVVVASSSDVTSNLPSTTSKRPGQTPCWDPALCKVGDLIFLFYKIGESPYSWTGALKRSHDGGKTWSHVQLLARHGVVGPHKNKPLFLSDGSLVCPSARSSWQSWTGFVDILHNAGTSEETWQAVGPLTYQDQASGILQPTLFFDHENNLCMIFRTKNLPFLCTTTSFDGGKTWSEVVPTSLQSNDSCCDAVTLRDKRVLLIYNDLPAGDRYTLHSTLSYNGGKTWEKSIVLDACENHDNDVCFPSVIQALDGLVHVLYVYNYEYIKHIVLDPSNL